MLTQQRPVSNWENHGSTHSRSKIPRKFSVIKKKVYFSTNHFFPQVVFSGAGIWSREDINRPSRSHTPVESPTVLRVSPDNTVRPDQSNCLSPNRHPPVSQPDISSVCLFYLFNEQNKLNLLVSLIFLATTRLYITERSFFPKRSSLKVQSYFSWSHSPYFTQICQKSF